MLSFAWGSPHPGPQENTPPWDPNGPLPVPSAPAHPQVPQSWSDLLPSIPSSCRPGGGEGTPLGSRPPVRLPDGVEPPLPPGPGGVGLRACWGLCLLAPRLPAQAGQGPTDHTWEPGQETLRPVLRCLTGAPSLPGPSHGLDPSVSALAGNQVQASDAPAGTPVFSGSEHVRIHEQHAPGSLELAHRCQGT